MSGPPYRPGPEEVAAEEREVLERVRREWLSPPRLSARARQILAASAHQPATVDAVDLVGRYPQTMIRVTARRGGVTHTGEWPIWDGTLIGGPPGVASPQGFAQMLGVQILYWQTAPTWKDDINPIELPEVDGHLIDEHRGSEAE